MRAIVIHCRRRRCFQTIHNALAFSSSSSSKRIFFKENILPRSSRPIRILLIISHSANVYFLTQKVKTLSRKKREKERKREKKRERERERKKEREREREREAAVTQ